LRDAAAIGALAASLVVAGAAVAQDAPADEPGPESLPQAEKTGPVYEPAVIYDEFGKPMDPCRKFDAQYESWLDRSQVGLYRTVCTTAAWFDGFFGDFRYDEKTGDTYGRFSIGGFYDRRDKLDNTVRLRGKYAFAAMRERGSVFVRQGDEDDIIDERGGEASEQSVEALSRSEDTALFAGFGFDRSRNLERGFSLRLGAKIRAPIEPFVKARYRYGWRLNDATLVRLRPVVYWKSEEGIGATLGLEADNYISDNLLLRWDNSGNVSQDREVQGMRWRSTLSLFQALTAKRALTYSAFITGETEAESKLQNYGFEVKFRHRFLREWLFLEYVGSTSWPREFLAEERKLNPGIGIRFEVYFGPQPEDELR